jgi:hypothetical protein
MYTAVRGTRGAPPTIFIAAAQHTPRIRNRRAAFTARASTRGPRSRHHRHRSNQARNRVADVPMMARYYNMQWARSVLLCVCVLASSRGAKACDSTLPGCGDPEGPSAPRCCTVDGDCCADQACGADGWCVETPPQRTRHLAQRDCRGPYSSCGDDEPCCDIDGTPVCTDGVCKYSCVPESYGCKDCCRGVCSYSSTCRVPCLGAYYDSRNGYSTTGTCSSAAGPTSASQAPACGTATGHPRPAPQSAPRAAIAATGRRAVPAAVSAAPTLATPAAAAGTAVAPSSVALVATAELHPLLQHL